MLEHRAGHSGLSGAGNTAHRSSALWHGVSRTAGYRGPERRNGSALLGRLMALALDEIDYGVLMIGDDQQVLHCNHAARLELGGEHPLVLEGDQLWTREEPDLLTLQEALDGARRRGMRRLVRLGEGENRRVISVVPLSSAPSSEAGSACLLVLGKSPTCGSLAIQGFARVHKLSPGEVQVLMALCDGAVPADIAATHGVAISTVRTQIANIRSKTGAASIRELVRQVAILPPLVGALRHGSEGAAGRSGSRAPARACADFMSVLLSAQG